MADWKPGDLANGHVLGEDLVWRPLETSDHTRSRPATWDEKRDAAHAKRNAKAIAEWPDTRMPTRGKLNGKASAAIRNLCVDGQDPWLILVSPVAAGVLAAWEDRLSVIKTGAVTGFMAGSLGGERSATFHYVDITGVEYNSGLVNGVLEILTPSYSGSANKDFWRGIGSPNADNNNPYALSNTLPLSKDDHKQALQEINDLRRRVGEAKRPASTVPPAPVPDVMDQLKKLAELHAAGIVTDDEFAAKKADLLGRI